MSHHVDLREHLATLVLCLLLVDELHENTLVLEDITLDLHVQLVVPVKTRQHSTLENTLENTHQMR